MNRRFIGMHGPRLAAWMAAVVVAVGSAAIPAGASAAAWFTPTDLPATAPFPYIPYHPDAIAMSPAGNVLYGWVANDASGDVNHLPVIHLVLRPAGGPALPEQTFTAPTPSIGSVSVAVNDRGDAIATWGAGGVYGPIHYVIRHPGGGFGPAATPPYYTEDNQDESPAVGLAANGTATFAFGQNCKIPSDAYSTEAVVLERAPDGTWGARHPLATTGDGHCGDNTSYLGFRVSELPDGRAIVGFNRTPDSGIAADEAWSAIRSTATSPFVSTMRGTGQNTSVAIEPGGAAITAWEVESLVGALHMAWIYHPRSGADVPQALYDGVAPQVAMGAAGEALIAFASPSTSMHPGVVRVGPTGVADPAQTMTSGIGPTALPQIAADATGRAALVYRNNDADDGLEGLTRAPGGSFGGATKLGAGAEDYPVLAGDSTGDIGVMGILITISENSDVRRPVFYAYDGAPPKITRAAGPSTLVTGQAGNWSLGASDVWAGPLSVAWSFGDGGAGSGPNATHTFASPGRKTVRGVVTDSRGNVATTTLATEVRLPPPQTTITEHPKAKMSTRRSVVTITFAFRSSEPHSTFRCKLDSGSFRDCRSPRDYKVRSGRHSFGVQAINADGSRDTTPATFSFRVVRRR